MLCPSSSLLAFGILQFPVYHKETQEVTTNRKNLQWRARKSSYIYEEIISSYTSKELWLVNSLKSADFLSLKKKKKREIKKKKR